jgi:hypothetical protein
MYAKRPRFAPRGRGEDPPYRTSIGRDALCRVLNCASPFSQRSKTDRLHLSASYGALEPSAPAFSGRGLTR